MVADHGCKQSYRGRESAVDNRMLGSQRGLWVL